MDYQNFLASGDFCRLLIIFANSSDQDLHEGGPDLGTNSQTLLSVPEIIFIYRSANRIDLLITPPASGDFCHLLVIFANSLYPDQDRHNDLGKNRLTLCENFYL